MTRKYELKRRAAQKEETRQRIVEAAVELHSTVGPNRTTISAVAERAGVTRPTVYAYFPDEMSLFMACSAHGMAADPMPDASAWSSIEDPKERLRVALGQMYAYYRRNMARMSNILRDAETSPRMREMGNPMEMMRAWMRDILTAGWVTESGKEEVLQGAVAHALDFFAWRSLAKTLPDAEIVELMERLVRGAAGDCCRDHG